MIYRVTEQIAVVTELSYDIEATDEDHAYELLSEDRESQTLVHSEILNKHTEFLSAEVMS